LHGGINYLCFLNLNLQATLIKTGETILPVFDFL